MSKRAGVAPQLDDQPDRPPSGHIQVWRSPVLEAAMRKPILNERDRQA